MSAPERRSLRLQLQVIFRLAEREDLPKLEWYGKYTHFRRLFERTYQEQLRGERLMLLADATASQSGRFSSNWAAPRSCGCPSTPICTRCA